MKSDDNHCITTGTTGIKTQRIPVELEAWIQLEIKQMDGLSGFLYSLINPQ